MDKRIPALRHPIHLLPLCLTCQCPLFTSHFRELIYKGQWLVACADLPRWRRSSQYSNLSGLPSMIALLISRQAAIPYTKSLVLWASSVVLQLLVRSLPSNTARFTFPPEGNSHLHHENLRGLWAQSIHSGISVDHRISVHRFGHCRCTIFYPILRVSTVKISRHMSQDYVVLARRVYLCEQHLHIPSVILLNSYHLQRCVDSILTGACLITPIANETLSILMVIFEYSSAILTTVRCVQAFHVAGSSWRDQKGGIIFLIFEQGIHDIIPFRMGASHSPITFTTQEYFTLG